VTISEASRHALHMRLAEVLGPEEAVALMEYLPPVGWADVATKRDLDHLGIEIRGEVVGARGEIAELRGEMLAMGGALVPRRAGLPTAGRQSAESHRRWSTAWRRVRWLVQRDRHLP
jgi:hypothetical protein